jgi:hypothetical protein
VRGRSPLDGKTIVELGALIVGDYVSDYEMPSYAILILAIRHGRQNPPEPKLDDDFDFER